MQNRTILCVPTPRRVSSKPSFSMQLAGINTEPNKWLQEAIMKKLATTRKRTDPKTGEPANKVTHRGAVCVLGDDHHDDVIIIVTHGRDGYFKLAGRVHLILQELLGEELDLDRGLLHPRTSSPARLSRAVAEVHRRPAQV